MSTNGRAIDPFLADLDKCLRCGFCMAVCPTYAETAREDYVARGRLNLIQQQVKPLPVPFLAEDPEHVKEPYKPPAAGEPGNGGSNGADDVAEQAQPRNLAINARDIREPLFSCLGCLACETACPSGVPVTAIVSAARADFVGRYGMSAVKRMAIQGVLAHPAFLAWGARLASFGQGLFFQNLSRQLPDGAGHQRPRCRLPLVSRRVFPRAARVPLATRLRHLPGPEGPHRRVAFFPGCLLSVAYTDVGVALHNLLAKRGVAMITPAEWVCCGLPAQVHGAWATARQQVLHNLKIMEALLDAGVERVLTACASCGSQLAHHAAALFAGEPAVQGRLQRAAEHVQDATAYLVDVLDFQPGPFVVAGSMIVTYHDPCHLVRGLGVREQPRELLRRLPGIHPVEMKEADRCCGGAGIYFLEHPDLSATIRHHKLQAIAQTRAQLVATACPACMMQLEDGLVEEEMGAETVHILQLLDDSEHPPAEQRRYRSRTAACSPGTTQSSSPGERVAAAGTGNASPANLPFRLCGF